MNKNNSKELLTLSELSLTPLYTVDQFFEIQTSNGPRPITLRSINRKDGNLIADVRTEYNPLEISSHMIINPVKTRVFISK